MLRNRKNGSLAAALDGDPTLEEIFCGDGVFAIIAQITDVPKGISPSSK